MKLIICDRCREELKEERYTIQISKKLKGKYSPIDIDEVKELVGVELCENCIKEIAKGVLNKPDAKDEKTVNKKKAKQEKKEEAKKERFDISKCMALRNAGWTNTKIADEMGKTAQYIANAVCLAKSGKIKGYEQSGCDGVAADVTRIQEM